MKANVIKFEKKQSPEMSVVWSRPQYCNAITLKDTLCHAGAPHGLHEVCIKFNNETPFATQNHNHRTVFLCGIHLKQLTLKGLVRLTEL